jgi:hypothetical protein
MNNEYVRCVRSSTGYVRGSYELYSFCVQYTFTMYIKQYAQ